MKRETRILGISTPARPLKPVPVVGVVFRGNLWLDGVITCTLTPTKRGYLSDLAKMIKESRQYSQIRAVILAKPRLITGITTNPDALADKIQLPTIVIRDENQTGDRRIPQKALCWPLGSAGPPTSLSSESTCEFASEVFKIGCVDGSGVPEAVRVANLIANEISPSFLKPKAK